MVWLICFSSVIQWCSFLPRDQPSMAQTMSIPNNPLQLTESETQLMDLKRSLEISPRILTGRELMKVNAIYEANNQFFFFFYLNPQRYPKYLYWWCIGFWKKNCNAGLLRFQNFTAVIIQCYFYFLETPKIWNRTSQSRASETLKSFEILEYCYTPLTLLKVSFGCDEYHLE